MIQTLVPYNRLDGACLVVIFLVGDEFVYCQCSAELGIHSRISLQTALLMPIRWVRNPRTRKFVTDT
jgi:hypothetical protein